MQSPETSAASYTLTTSLATTPPIKYPSRGGMVHIPSGSTITALTWGSLDPINITRMAANSEDGTTPTAQTGLSAGNAYPIPKDLFGCHTIFAVADAAGAVVISQKG